MNNIKWYYIAIIVLILGVTAYAMEELYLDKMMQMQQVSRQVIEK